MTRMEKQIVVRALEFYGNAQIAAREKAEAIRDYQAMAKATGEKCMAFAVAETFRAILDEKCGTVKI